jgi:hypothetical protein
MLPQQPLHTIRTSGLGAAKIGGMIAIPALYNTHATPPWVFGSDKPNLPSEVSLGYSVEFGFLLRLTFSPPTSILSILSRPGDIEKF